VRHDKIPPGTTASLESLAIHLLVAGAVIGALTAVVLGIVQGIEWESAGMGLLVFLPALAVCVIAL
jgi:hypothetical protein